jgi:hypothetical protein
MCESAIHHHSSPPADPDRFSGLGPGFMSAGTLSAGTSKPATQGRPKTNQWIVVKKFVMDGSGLVEAPPVPPSASGWF